VGTRNTPRQKSRERSFLDPVRGVETELFRTLCSAIDSPLSLAAWLLYSHKEYEQLVNLKIDAGHYDSVRSFEDDYQVVNTFSKYVDFKTGIDREAVAFDKWLASEASCRLVNEKLRSYWEGDCSLVPFPVSEVLHRAQRKISEILGPIKDRELEDWVCTHGRFGPGSDLSTSGVHTSSYNKYEKPGSITPGALAFAEAVFDDDRRQELPDHAECVRGSRLSFVPKNAKTDRAICVEPRWNIYLQLGIGEYIVRRLRKVGCDLSSQDTNRKFAARAHRDGLATIDLSSASDTISKNLILMLLPEDWSDILFQLRSPTTSYRGKTFLLEKISSMGNGYTFPLETLIFLAIARAICDEHSLGYDDVTVYGDDIIVPREIVPQLLEVFSCIGFTVNSAKSFVTGNFFESCGHDYFKGQNVRPFFLKGEVNTVERAYTLANQVLEVARRRSSYCGVDPSLGLVHRVVVNFVPKSHRLYGPVGLSGVLHATFDRARPVKARNGWEGFMVLAYVAVPIPRHGYDYYGHLFSKLSADVDSSNRYYTRRSVEWRRKKVYLPMYTDFFDLT
jgi:hypothetical protein